MVRVDAGDEAFNVLTESLQVLAHPARLAILATLRVPRPLHKIEVVVPDDDRADGRRVLSRQAVSWHLEKLVDEGLVQRRPGPGRGNRFVLNHPRVFAFVDGLQQLVHLVPVTRGEDGMEATLGGEQARGPGPIDGARLVVVYGRDEGRAFDLDGGPGAAWSMGREEACEVSLDYDPFASGVHARIRREEEGYAIEDTGSRNGTLVNGVPLEEGATHRLAAGDVLTVGRSRLVFQA